MENLNIEYRDGKLIEFIVDGVQFNSVAAIGFSHDLGEALPMVSMTIPLGVA